MRTLCFVICFSLGVSLMVASGYMPHAAKARGAVAVAGESASRAVEPAAHRVSRPIEVGRRGAGEPEPTEPAAQIVPPPADPAPPAPVEDPQPSYQKSAPAAAIPTPPVERAAPPQPVAPVATAAPEPPSPRAPEGESGPPRRRPRAGAAPDGGSAAPPSAAELEALRQRAIASKEGAGEPALKASAGKPQAFWSGWDELTLDGSASVGRNLTYRWRQLDGPPLAIQNEAAPTTVATGLAQTTPQWRPIPVRFELQVTSESGQVSTATVVHNIRYAPTLRLSPAPERRFEQRDAYMLAHFSVTASGGDALEQTFEVGGEGELTFTKIGGGVYTQAGGKTEHGAVYQITVYRQPGEASTSVEFLVDSEERVPAIIALTATWRAADLTAVGQ